MEDGSSKTLGILGYVNLNTLIIHLIDSPEAEIGALTQTRIESQVHMQEIIRGPVRKFLDRIGELIFIFGEVQAVMELAKEKSDALDLCRWNRMEQVERLETLLGLNNFREDHR